VRDLLRTSRVVSIVGPGGLGKTRLANVVGRDAEQRLVHFVALAAINSDSDVAAEVASSIGDAAQPGKGEAVLTGWRMLLDSGRLQDGEPYLAGTARVPVVRLSATTAGEIGAAEGDFVTVATNRGEITLPLEITDMDDRVVWLPLNSPGSAVYQQLGVTAGAVVSIGAAEQ